MASIWEFTVTLLDSAQNTTSIRFKLGEVTGADFAAEATAALATASAITTALNAITDANIMASRLSTINETTINGAIPGGDVDITDEALVLVHTNDTNYPDELARLRVPAPVAGLFVNSNREEGVDVADADLQTYVALFGSSVEISDGEHVNTAEGTAGIKSGYWRSRPGRLESA